MSESAEIHDDLHLNFVLYLEVYRLANIKSAKKRILVNETKAARNKAIKYSAARSDR